MITENLEKVNCLQDYAQHKQFAVRLQTTLASFYKDKKSISDANVLSQKGLSILNCGSHLEFERYKNPEQTMRLAGANFCKHRLCPYCAWRWHVKYANILQRTFQILGAHNFYHLVLTIPNIKFLNKEFLSNLKQNATKFMTKALKCNDYLISFEITIDKIGQFHPHFHIICILDKQPTRKYLQTEWAKFANCGAYAICNIKKCTDNRISQELTKYILKFEDDKISAEKLFIINKALKGLKKFASRGKIKTAEEQAKQELQREMFDKIQELKNFDSEMLFYEWIGGSYNLSKTIDIPKNTKSAQIDIEPIKTAFSHCG